MPRIVVLDGFTLTPNEPHRVIDPAEPTWDELTKLGDVEVFARTADVQVADRMGDAGVALTNKTALSRETIEALPALRYVGVMATGVNVVDLAAARERGITVTNVPGYSGGSVAQHVFALLLELASAVGDHAKAVRESEWARSADFAFTTQPLLELAGKRLGIVGMGDIGQKVAAIGHAFGMSIVANTRTRKPLPFPVEWVDLDTLFAASDVVTLHCPLTDATRGLVDSARLATMKPTAYLINTGRGPLVDEAALAAALNEGRLAGAGLDVLIAEPPALDNPLFSARNCVITPHVAWATREARHRLLKRVVDNLRAFLEGTPRNVVS